MTAQEILKLIEEVSPDDTAKLDEIDARVWCWIEGVKYKEHENWGDGRKSLAVFYHGGSVAHWGYRYTRSRDALKQIRPKGYYFRLGEWNSQTGNLMDAVFEFSLDTDKASVNYRTTNKTITGFTGVAKTEELAELHAIIQAIEYERNNA